MLYNCNHELLVLKEAAILDFPTFRTILHSVLVSFMVH